jgi:hypothetical protein
MQKGTAKEFISATAIRLMGEREKKLTKVNMKFKKGKQRHDVYILYRCPLHLYTGCLRRHDERGPAYATSLQTQHSSLETFKDEGSYIRLTPA